MKDSTDIIFIVIGKEVLFSTNYTALENLYSNVTLIYVLYDKLVSYNSSINY